jgi:hypothetical protein
MSSKVTFAAVSMGVNIFIFSNTPFIILLATDSAFVSAPINSP